MSQSAAVQAVTDGSFAHEVLASARPVLVDFTADWCPGCRMIAPVLEQVAADRAGGLRVVTLNVDANAEVPAAYAVLATPTLLLFRAGEPIRTLIGARSKRRLLQELDEALG